MVRRWGSWAAVLVAAATLILPSAAQAAWLKIETDRFVVYSDGRRSELTAFVTKLSTFDAMLRVVYPRTAGPPDTSKLVIYLVRGGATLERLKPDVANGTLGYYSAAPSGDYAVVSRGGALLGEDIVMGADEVLFHEYMHRFMYENFPASYPAWLTEAYAEYFQTADIKPETTDLGRFSEVRGVSLMAENWLPMDKVLGKTVAETHPMERNAFYAQAWLFLHYMLSDERRTGQLATALKAMGEGADSVTAIHEATGMNGRALSAALKVYAQGHLPMRRIRNPPRPEITFEIVELSPSADDLLLEGQRLADGVEENDQPKVLAEIRKRAARHPGDRLAELTLAKAETSFGDLAVGQVILDRWLAAEPNSAETLRLAAEGHISAATRNPATAQDQYRAARTLLGRAHALDKRDFRILYQYVHARAVEPGYPSENDLNVLLLAHRLAPSVQEISYEIGAILMRKGRYQEARLMLLPIANNPHGGELSVCAKTLLDANAPATSAPTATTAPPNTSCSG